MRRKQLLVFLAAVVAFSAIIFPAQATSPKDADGEHKVYICHETGSATNRYVVIHVDVAADPAHQAHGDAPGTRYPVECEIGG